MSRSRPLPPLAPDQFVAALTRGRRAEQEVAFARLRSVVRGLLRRQARFRQLTEPEREEAVNEAAQDYVLDLLKNPARLAVATTRGWGLLRTDVDHVLGRGPTGQSIEEANDRLQRHFRDKVGEALRASERFVRLVDQRWTLAAGLPGPPTDDPTVLEHAPPLPSRLAWSREDQLAPIADRAPLIEHLAALLRLSGRPRWAAELAKLAWQGLDPPPTPPRRAEPPRNGPEEKGWEELLAGEDSPEQAVAALQWRDRIDQVAWRVVQRLTPRTREAARRRYREPDQPLTLEQLGAALGCSRGTADAEVGTQGKLNAAVREVAREESLSEAQGLQLHAVVLDLLRTAPEAVLERAAADRRPPPPPGAEPW